MSLRNLFLSLLLLASLGLANAAHAQATPYSVSHKEALKVGAKVWVNVGDNPCAYSRKGTGLSTAARCFRSGDYVKARIIAQNRVTPNYINYDTGKLATPFYTYTIVGTYRRTRHTFTYEARFDMLYVMHGAPRRYAAYSNKILLLNW